ncbi:MAG: PD-(D/E)XK nuclease family protein [Candidatus Eisenbacteria bacterium]|nr:PD-(D/E)XK nuclease family protein [Candidatus Eisenbacteria bacterium]
MNRPASPVLLTGPPGSGKTEKMVRLFLEGDGGSAEGGRALVLLPDRGAVEIFRRRVLEGAGVAGVFDGGIRTFESWAIHRLGRTPEEGAAPEEESLLLRAVAADLPAAVGTRALSPRFRGAFLAWAADLGEAGIDPASIREMLLHAPDEEGRLETLAETLDRFLREREGAGLFHAAAALLRAAERLASGADRAPLPDLLLVDGFHRFSSPRLALLRELASRVGETWITLPSPSGNGEWTGEALERSFALLSSEIGPFREERLSAKGPEPRPLFLGGADREEVVERIAREIRIACAEEGRRPGDHLILFRDVEPYRVLVEEIFPRYGVPFHGRFQTAGAETRAGRSLLDWIRLAREGVRVSTVLPILKNRMTGADPDHADRLAARLREAPDAEEGGEALLLRARGADPGFASAHLEPLAAFAAETGSVRGSAAVEALLRWWEEGIEASVRADAVPERDGPLHAAAWNRYREFLDRTVRAFRRRPALDSMDAAEALEIVEAEARRIRVSYAVGPPGGARVDDFRHGQNLSAPVLFLAGLEAALCPRAYQSGSFWTETDRERLGESGQYRVPDREEHRIEERYLFRRAWTRATEMVYFCSPAFERTGDASPPSPYLLEARESIGAERFEDRGAVERFATSRSLAVEADLFPFLAARADPAEGDGPGVGLAAALFRERTPRIPSEPRRFDEPVRVGGVKPFRVWAARRKAHTVSALEDFGACPYRYLARHVYRLDEPEEPPFFGFPLTREGELIHAVLEEALRAGGDPAALLGEKAMRALGGVPERVGHRLAAERLREGLALLLEEDLRFREEHGWEPVAYERSFGGEDRPFLAGGVPVRGRIDRVDRSPAGDLLVIDYKRSARRGPGLARDLEAGLSLALPLYLLAARELHGGRPVGAFLLGLGDPVRGGFYDTRFVAEGVVPEKRAGSAVPMEGERMDALLAGVRERTAEIAREIESGEFPVEPADDRTCERLHCPYRDLCRIVLAALEDGE